MKTGRPRKPTELHLIEGTYRARRHGDHPVRAKAAMPTPPAHIGTIAKTEWRRVAPLLYELGVLTRIDRAVLAAYCMAYERWVIAERSLAAMAERDLLTSALMIKTTNGNALQNPLVGTANRAMLDVVKFSGELGLTPASRARLNAVPDGGGGDGTDLRKKYGF